MKPNLLQILVSILLSGLLVACAGALPLTKLSPTPPPINPLPTDTPTFTVTPTVTPMPAAMQTAQAATQAAFPVTGSITFEGGRCCAGGTEGEQIPIHAQFQASSPAGKVTEMRIAAGFCQSNSAGLDASWEPFVPSKTYYVTLMLNWTSFQLNVQYRDEKDNLSPVYCALITLEGMP